MKKYIILVVFFSILAGYNNAQNSVVIESFDSWGSNGLPSGYEWYNPAPEAVEKVAGYSGSAIRLYELYSTSLSGRYGFSNYDNPIPVTGKVPDSLIIYCQSSQPPGFGYEIRIRFYNGDQDVAGVTITTAWGPPTGWKRWGCPIQTGNPDAVFDNITIRVDVLVNQYQNNEWTSFDEFTIKWKSTIELIQPTGGIKWMAGDKRLIQWIAENEKMIY
jgi:hypothetical protein